jgi:hypothetical protein
VLGVLAADALAHLALAQTLNQADVVEARVGSWTTSSLMPSGS